MEAEPLEQQCYLRRRTFTKKAAVGIARFRGDVAPFGNGKDDCSTGLEQLPDLVRELEQCLAAFKQVAAALVFPSGYMANLGVITALAGPRDRVVIDRLAHASIVDGARLARARLCVFPI